MTRRIPQILFVVFVVAIAVSAGFFAYRQWQAGSAAAAAGSATMPADTPIADGEVPVRVSPQARANMGVISKPLALTTYWRKIDVPGFITNRPGISDRGVTAPVTGVVTKIHAYPGDTVQPNTPLFSLRLISETLHASQLELFKATKEIEIARQQRQRLEGLSQSGALPGSRLIEIDNQIQRMGVTVQAYRQDLLSRGLPPERIDAAAKGEFVTEITIPAPGEQALQVAEVALAAAVEDEPGRLPFSFELQELKVELGQQVEAGQVLCYLADHRALLIEGRGFKDDMPLIQQAAQDSLPIEVDFELGEGGDWPALPENFLIHHMTNVIDVESRTFGFFLPLDNQWQAYTRHSQTHLVWRFKPGDRLRLRVAVEKLENVFVLPQAAVVREGPEAFVFRQNGDLFDRRAVHVLAEDRTHVVIANDGSLRTGSYLAQNAAASLNRVLKAQIASGVPANVHVHADGTTHAPH